MYVCICNKVSDGDIRQAIKEIGVFAESVTLDKIIEKTKAGKKCGICKMYLQELLEKHAESKVEVSVK